MMDVSITDYVKHKQPDLPEKIRKGNAIVQVWDWVCSGLAKLRWNYVFVGVLPARRVGNKILPKEHVLGFAEIMKGTDGLSPYDVRFARFLSLKELKKFHSILEDYIRFMEGRM